jgi:hypothetical protein
MRAAIYRNVPQEDFTRQGDYGRPAVLGIRQEILAEEATPPVSPHPAHT